MKTLLIATDFSKASRHASLYGLQLAKTMEANVILFTAYTSPHPIAALPIQSSHYDVMMQMEKKLNDEADRIANDERARITVVCGEGTAVDTILSVAAEKKVDLIITGMKGEGNNIKKLFGSTTTSLVRQSNIPIIVVPEEATFSHPATLLYASDVFLDITIQPIDQVQWITGFFKSKLVVVRIVKDDYEKLLEDVNLPQRLRSGLTIMNTTFQFPVNTNVTAGLSDFIKMQPVDLLVMKPHKQGWIDRLFIKSETKEMLFHSHTPLLILPTIPEQETGRTPVIGKEIEVVL